MGKESSREERKLMLKYKWYSEGSPLIKLLAGELYKARFDDVNSDGDMYNSDSNALVNVIELEIEIRKAL